MFKTLLCRSLALLTVLCLSAANGSPCHQYDQKIESPCNEVIQKKDGYEIRQYSVNQTAFFTAAYVGSSDFAVAVKTGFDKNFAYISGANSKKEKIPMTAPVVFKRDHATDGWLVGFFIPSTYRNKEEVPKPTDKSITIVEVPKETTFAVTEFGGFATKSDFNEAVHRLSQRLQEDDVKVVHDEQLLIWASYDSPLTLFDRHNEVWLHVEASKNATSSEAVPLNSNLFADQ